MSIESISSAGLPYAVGLQAQDAAALGQAQPVTGIAAVGSCDCGQPDCPICGPAMSAAEDTLELSPAAEELLSATPTQETTDPEQTQTPPPPAKSAGSVNSSDELTDEEQAQVDELQQTDREVRAHEQAHLAAAGGNATGGASFEYKTGPDGKRYAVAGEVQIDVSTVPDDPDATIRKMEQVRAAALAPADPSAQDRSVAAQALQAIQEARSESSESDESSSDQDDVSAANSKDASSQSGASKSTSKRDKRFEQPESAVAMVLDVYA